MRFQEEDREFNHNFRYTHIFYNSHINKQVNFSDIINTRQIIIRRYFDPPTIDLRESRDVMTESRCAYSIMKKSSNRLDDKYRCMLSLIKLTTPNKSD